MQIEYVYAKQVYLEILVSNMVGKRKVGSFVKDTLDPAQNS